MNFAQRKYNGFHPCGAFSQSWTTHPLPLSPIRSWSLGKDHFEYTFTFDVLGSFRASHAEMHASILLLNSPL